MEIRKILGNVNKSYNDYLDKSEKKYREKQSKFLNAKAQRELQIRKLENEEEMKRGRKPLDPKYVEYGSFPGLSQALKEYSQRHKERGTTSSAVRREIK